MKQITLQEALDQVAKNQIKSVNDEGGEIWCKNFQDFIYDANVAEVQEVLTEAAELYASTLKADNEKLRAMLKKFVDSAYASNTYGFINEAKELLNK